MSFRDSYRDKKVMLTGGLGFIGSNLAHRLVECDADVLIVDSLIPEYGGNLFNVDGIRDRVRVNIADIRDSSGMDYLVRGQDYIFNLAGQVSHIDSMRDPYTDLEINCRSQLSLLEACRRNNPAVKIIHASTRQIYGVPDYLPVDEKHLLHPTDVNGINKMAGEWYHILYSHVYGIRATSLRLTNTYGPRQLMKHNRQGFIGWFIRLAIDGEEISVYGDGQQLRDLNYVDDAVEAFLLAGATDEVNGSVYNLGGPEPVSLLHIVETLMELCPEASYKLVPFPPEKKRIDIGDYYGDYSRIRKALGWEPQVGLREGLARTIEYYRQHKAHYWE
jgi:UDP-glucose 4-epimerase